MATPPRRTSPKLKVVLVPWDPDSREHVGRLFAQRVACGWKSELVESKWTALQRTGEMAIVWVVSLFLWYCSTILESILRPNRV